MNRVNDLFETEVGSFWDTMMAHNGSAGYTIPEYQRQYNWDKDHLERLLADCLNGFFRLSESTKNSTDPEYTFLGSIILVADRDNEPTFDGVSLSVVDGQQRLTSLILVACALFQKLREHQDDIKMLTDGTRYWLNTEIEAQFVSLRQCILGQFERLNGNFPYPRMIRSEDARGDSPLQSEYKSAIGRYLLQFANFVYGVTKEFEPEAPITADPAWNHLLSNFSIIYHQLDIRLYQGDNHSDESDSEESEEDVNIVPRSAFQKASFHKLFRRRDVLRNDQEKNRCSAELSKSASTEGLVRLLLFTSYLTQRVVLTRVEAYSEADAFDIFDALNTTGEPLTALETCKPLVIQFERDQEGFSGSPCDLYWKSLESGLTDTYKEPETLQKETKKLLTSFALYLEGHKLSLDLKAQRSFLRSRFRKVERKGPDNARSFVRSISELAEFRLQFWDKAAIDSLSVSQYKPRDLDILKLCLRFISDMNTSLAIPVLARYWAELGANDKEGIFVSATKAIAAFLALRRAVTGGTARIDTDFRNLMENPYLDDKDPLCIGIEFENELLDLGDLKSILRTFLQARRIGVQDKASWVAGVKDVEFGNQAAPRPLTRFLLLAATHNARAVKSKPGLLTTRDVVRSAERDFFNHRNWVDEKYATLEHIAPDAGPNGGWDPTIYGRSATRHTIGNLVLLPEKENQSIGNAAWEKKRIFYRILSENKDSKRENLIKEAASEGLKFGKKTWTLIHNQEHLLMLESLANVDEWTADLIEDRTENILDLAWGQIAPWLYD